MPTPNNELKEFLGSAPVTPTRKMYSFYEEDSDSSRSKKRNNNKENNIFKFDEEFYEDSS